MGREMIIDPPASEVGDSSTEYELADPPEVRRPIDPDSEAAIMLNINRSAIELYLRNNTTCCKALELVEIDGDPSIVIGFEKIDYWARDVREHLRYTFFPRDSYPRLIFEEVRIFRPKA
ncbi:hypothetical protein TWF696_000359 [Orbilia brochopaga]|uniref:Uncharacterized protein n=1 Tax=Orbilia brochopaga TaxID=3140254 RepID=A0AAV9VB56_9PEZI